MPWYPKPLEVNLEDFEPTGRYSDAELEAYADAMLKQDARDNGNQGIMFADHLRRRKNREILTTDGTVEGIINHSYKDKAPGRYIGDGQGIYNRTHPRGRKVNSADQRKRNGASYFKG